MPSPLHPVSRQICFLCVVFSNQQAQLKAQAKNKKPERRGCWMWVNAKTLEGALDPLFLAFSLCVSLSAIAAGIFTIIKSNSFNFTVNSWDDFTQVHYSNSNPYPLTSA